MSQESNLAYQCYWVPGNMCNLSKTRKLCSLQQWIRGLQMSRRTCFVTKCKLFTYLFIFSLIDKCLSKYLYVHVFKFFNIKISDQFKNNIIEGNRLKLCKMEQQLYLLVLHIKQDNSNKPLLILLVLQATIKRSFC